MTNPPEYVRFLSSAENTNGLQPEAVSEAMGVCSCAPDCGERIGCATVGRSGHLQCGWCETHDRARHCCGCIVTSSGSATSPTERPGVGA